jgi:hypothetical protein
MKKVTIRTLIAGAAALSVALLVLPLRGSEKGAEARPVPSAGPAADLRQRIAQFTAPFDRGTGYRPSGRAERAAVARGLALALDGRRGASRRELDAVDYELRYIEDATTGRRFAELRDRTDDLTRPRGWARVYFGLDSPARWSVQVPHPVSDLATEDLGASVLLGSPGGVLVIAGAHRRAGRDGEADAAHRTDTVFDAICEELARRGLPGLQIHGFADASAPGHDVVASTGRGRVALTEGRLLAGALRDRGFAVCRGWARDCPLEGRTNVQGRRAAALGVPFLHVEFGNRLRTDARHRARAVEAMVTMTATWARPR